jgi:L-amino acid N-acyltransferase YncA
MTNRRNDTRASRAGTLEAKVREMVRGDWATVQRIYDAGIATANATFETRPPAWEQWDANHRQDLRFVAVLDEKVVGWTAAGNASDRCCYAGVVEDSVYIDPAHHGLGIGRLLLSRLIDAATAAGVWTVQAGIFPENAASVALHISCGFRVVGRRELLGQLAGTWRDVLLMERRAPVGGSTPSSRSLSFNTTTKADH